MNRLLAVDDDRGRLAGLAAVLLALFVYTLLSRYPDWAAGVVFLITAVATAAVLGPAVALDRRPGPPPGWLSAMLVAGFALATGALLSLADVLGADRGDLQSSTATWVGLLLAGAFALIALRRDSAICTLLAAASLVVALVAGVDWIFSPDSATTFRWIFLVEAALLAAAGVALYGDRGRHGVVLVVLSGLVVLAIAASFGVSLISLGDGPIEGGPSGWWELVILAFGLGLAFFAAHTREPGPGYVAAILLLAFTFLQVGGAQEKLTWWPLLLLLGTGGAIAAFLAGTGRGGPGTAAAPVETEREVRL
jgi:hypothetical protein